MISPQFLQSLSAGEEDAIQSLVRAYQRPVFQLALSILDDGSGRETSSEAVAEAEAAAQDTFMVAIDRLNRYREEGAFEIWLFSIAIQVSRKHARWLKSPLRKLFGTRASLRQSAWSDTLVETAKPAGMYTPAAAHSSPVSPTAAPASSAQAAGAAHAGSTPSSSDDSLWQAIRRLDLKLRLPVVLRYYHDFPIETIARMLRLSEGAVHARLDAAREKIAGNLEKG